MFHKGQQVIICQNAGETSKQWKAEVVGIKPFKLKMLEGDPAQIEKDGNGSSLVDLQDSHFNETLMTARVVSADQGGIISLERLGTHEARQFVRVSAYLELSYDILDPDSPIDIMEGSEPQEQPSPMPTMSHIEMKTLARTEEASEAVLYLLQAVQILDRKLEALQETTNQLMENSKPSRMVHRKMTISGSGLRFENEEPLEEGTLLALNIRLPLGRVTTINTIAEVVRMDTLPASDGRAASFGTACKFVQIRESARERIVSFAIRKQREALRRMRRSTSGY